jgi:hypothetical protein
MIAIAMGSLTANIVVCECGSLLLDLCSVLTLVDTRTGVNLREFSTLCTYPKQNA